MTEAASRTPGPGSGPGGAPAAIALTPILAARWRTRDLDAIKAAAPGTRLVTIGFDGHPDGPLDDVEVMLRGRFPAELFDRILARAPSLRWVHSATAGVERVLTPASRARDLTITNARGVFSRPIAEYVMLMILAVSRRLPSLLELQAERTWQPLESRELRDVTVGIVGLGSIGRAVGALATAFGCRVDRHQAPPGVGLAGARGRGRRAVPRVDHAGPGALARAASRAPGRERLRGPRGAAHGGYPRARSARRRSHSSGRAPGSSTSPAASWSTTWPSAGRCATVASGARFSTPSTRSRCRRPRRCTTCPT